MNDATYVPPKVFCMACRFCDQQIGSGFGICRANPPVCIGAEMRGEWPIVHGSDWCGRGEFSK